MDELRCELVEAEAARDVNAQKVHALLSENQAICDQSGALSSEMSRLSLFLKESLQKRSDIVEYVKKEFMVEKERIVSDLKVTLRIPLKFLSLFYSTELHMCTNCAFSRHQRFCWLQ